MQTLSKVSPTYNKKKCFLAKSHYLWDIAVFQGHLVEDEEEGFFLKFS